MFKRVVSVLLLPTVLLTQLATAAHCHCRHVPGHDSHSHIHLTDLLFTQSDSCTHDHGDDDEDDDDDNCPAAPHDESPDHNANGIVYVPASLVHGWFTGRSSSLHDDAGCLSALAICANSLIEAPALVSANLPPPFLSVPGCPTFLRQQTLLI